MPEKIKKETKKKKAATIRKPKVTKATKPKIVKVRKPKVTRSTKPEAKNELPPAMGIIVVVLFFTLVLGVILLQQSSFQSETTIVAVSAANRCKNHAYQHTDPEGAQIQGWLSNEDGKEYIVIPKEEMAKLPKNETTRKLIRNEHNKVIAVDMRPDIKDSLQDSNRDNAKQLQIKGFATTCRGELLASLDYRDGIFRQYLR